MMIFKSRHTPGVKINETKLEKGETIIYKLLDNNLVHTVIDSEPMKHIQCKTYGYECVDHNGSRYFSDNARIVGLVEKKKK